MLCVCAKSCPTLCDPMDRRAPGSSVHEILQPRMLEWVVTPSSRGSSQPRDRTRISHVSCIGGQVLNHASGRQEARIQPTRERISHPQSPHHAVYSTHGPLLLTGWAHGLGGPLLLTGWAHGLGTGMWLWSRTHPECDPSLTLYLWHPGCLAPICKIRRQSSSQGQCEGEMD